ncbi:MAG: metallophosphatase family protein [Odoribacter sp.]|nr:metallophosphatase family protein [Odoribacter sp.]
MKRIGLLSDTHGYWDDRYALHFKECDEIWHAGDVGDMSILTRLGEVAPVVRAVAGNIDHGMVRRKCPELLNFELEGVKVLMTHIGGYPGKYSPGLKPLLRQYGTQLMVDGHSHILRVKYDHELNLLHINPGAAGVHGWQQVRTLVRFTLDNGAPHDLEVIELSKNYTAK